jgi:DNA-binding NarL/FixJ family response regulator
MANVIFRPCVVKEKPMLNDRIAVLAVHHRPLVREGLRAVLTAEGDFDVRAETLGCAEVVALHRVLRPDALIIGWRLTDGYASEAIARIRSEFPACRIVALTSRHRDQELYLAARAGAQGVIREDADPAQLIATLRLVLGGGRRVPEDYPPLPMCSGGVGLTRREQEVLQLLAEGQSNRSIGDALGIAEETVKSHVKNIFNKLGVSDRAEAAATAVHDGLVHF